MSVKYSNDYALESFRAAYKKAKSYPPASDNRKSYLRSIRSLNRIRGRRCDNGVRAIAIHPDFCEWSFCWAAGGLFGGFIFHKSCEEWSVHT